MIDQQRQQRVLHLKIGDQGTSRSTPRRSLMAVVMRATIIGHNSVPLFICARRAATLSAWAAILGALQQLKELLHHSTLFFQVGVYARIGGQNVAHQQQPAMQIRFIGIFTGRIENRFHQIRPA